MYMNFPFNILKVQFLVRTPLDRAGTVLAGRHKVYAKGPKISLANQNNFQILSSYEKKLTFLSSVLTDLYLCFY